MASRETERARAAGFPSYRQMPNARARERGFPSFSSEARARQYERQHPPKPDFQGPQPMRMLVRDPNAPGAYQELTLTPRTFRDASEVGKYWRARYEYLNPQTTRQGNRELNRFEQLTVNTVERGPVQLVSDRETLRETAVAGEVPAFPDLYEEANG